MDESALEEFDAYTKQKQKFMRTDTKSSQAYLNLKIGQIDFPTKMSYKQYKQELIR